MLHLGKRGRGIDLLGVEMPFEGAEFWAKDGFALLLGRRVAIISF